MPKVSDKSGKKSILFAESDSFLINIYQTKLELKGYKVFIANDGEKALNLVKRNPPDLILSEIVLPKINGFDLIKKIKKSKKLAGIPIVFLTNLSAKDDIKKAFDLGVDAYLIKAHNLPDEAVEKIIETLKKSKAKN